MKIDFHVHTAEYSACASSYLEEQVLAALSEGIDAMFITDHMKLHSIERLDEMNILYAPFKIYQGIEVTLQQDNYEDILVLGIHDKKIEKRDWSYEALYKYVKSKGGILILAHPYRFTDRIDNSIWDYPPDGIEVLSSNIGAYNYERRKVLAERLGAAVFTNSDSHHESTIAFHSNEFPDWCINEAAIIRAIKAREFKCEAL